MNKVEIDLETYNNLYDNLKIYEELKKQYDALMKTHIEFKKEKEAEIEKLNKEINNFLLNSLDLDSNRYVDTEINNFNIDVRGLAKYITENYLEKANKLFKEGESNE